MTSRVPKWLNCSNSRSYVLLWIFPSCWYPRFKWSPQDRIRWTKLVDIVLPRDQSRKKSPLPTMLVWRSRTWRLYLHTAAKMTWLSTIQRRTTTSVACTCIVHGAGRNSYRHVSLSRAKQILSWSVSSNRMFASKVFLATTWLLRESYEWQTWTMSNRWRCDPRLMTGTTSEIYLDGLFVVKYGWQNREI